jgi:uncharacterized protein (DUF433 family)
LPEVDGTLGFGFLDLMEARFVDGFRAATVPWRVIRLCAERARELTGRDHPLSSRRFRADGRTIFAEVVDQAGEKQLLDLGKNQLAFARVIGPSLYAGVEFSVDDMPARWWPMGEKREIVIDPTRSFGQPIVSDGGVPTAVLADAVEAEGSIAKVASLFRLPQHSVRAAVRYEKRLADHKLSLHLAHAFNILLGPEGDQVIHLTDRFPANAEDIVWMSAVGDEGGWVVISADRRIHCNRLEREAWRRSGLVVFFLTSQWRRLRNVEIAWRLLRWWPHIRGQARLVAPPAAFQLPLA